MKALGIALLLIGILAEFAALFLGYAAVIGGYYPMIGYGLAGRVSGGILVALYRDDSIATIFWLGLAFFLAGFWLIYRTRNR